MIKKTRYDKIDTQGLKSYFIDTHPLFIELKEQLGSFNEEISAANKT